MFMKPAMQAGQVLLGQAGMIRQQHVVQLCLTGLASTWHMDTPSPTMVRPANPSPAASSQVYHDIVAGSRLLAVLLRQLVAKAGVTVFALLLLLLLLLNASRQILFSRCRVHYCFTLQSACCK